MKLTLLLQRRPLFYIQNDAVDLLLNMLNCYASNVCVLDSFTESPSSNFTSKDNNGYSYLSSVARLIKIHHSHTLTRNLSRHCSCWLYFLIYFKLMTEKRFNDYTWRSEHIDASYSMIKFNLHNSRAFLGRQNNCRTDLMTIPESWANKSL